MSLVCFALGAATLGFWLFGVTRPAYDRPQIFWYHAWLVLTVGIILLLLGFGLNLWQTDSAQPPINLEGQNGEEAPGDPIWWSWWTVVLIVIALGVAVRRAFRAKGARAFDAFDEAMPWFTERSISEDSIRFSTYEDPELAERGGAVVLVGTGESAETGSLGFVVEVAPGQGVVQGLILDANLASWHRKIAATAMVSGLSLVTAFRKATEAQRD